MATIIVTTRQGEERIVEAASGHSLMEELRSAGIDEIQALCGGCAACCTCHVYVEAGPVDALPPMLEQEDELLDGSDARNPRSRLACQIEVSDALDGLRVRVAPEL
jgi:ferredoxin, 2Fe-2S